MTRILVVEDEVSFSDPLSYVLTKEGYEVAVAETGPAALAAFEQSGADLVLLDVMLPGLSGVDVCRTLRQRSSVPIIMLTAKDSEADIVTGLEMGAADYICKPFSPRVLMARIRAVLRRPATDVLNDTAGPTLTVGALTIDPGRHKVEIKGKEVPLTFTEFRILRLLAESPGRAFSRAQIVDHVRGESYSVTERIVDVQMVSLRKKLGNLGDWIETVRGVGYRFRET